MTDQDENRPLSRREMRLREMAAAGIQTDSEQEVSAPSETLNEVESAESEFQVEIPLLDEKGNPRSRRELRELREQAIAELKAETAATGDNAEDPLGELGFDPELTETAAFDVLAHNAQEEQSAQAEFDADADADAEQDAALEQATGVEANADVTEVAESSEETAFDALLQQAAAQEAGLGEQEDSEVDFEEVSALVEQSAPADSSAAFDESDTFEAEAAENDPEVSDDAEPLEVAEPTTDAEPEGDAELSAEPEPPVEAEPEVETDLAEVQPDVVNEDDAVLAGEEGKPQGNEEDFTAPVSASKGQAYSFPDITPLDEGLSIFDDPAIQIMGTGASQAEGALDRGHDFDELITRAVAQEGAVSTTNTSALILPVMPETDSISGPIGETGELFITGSFDLPKSLSETGGHASLHDSIDAEPFDELGFVEAAPTGAMAPVSASRAVSARSHQGPLVTEAARDKNKMPIVLIATGGVLVLGATGLIIWAATSGLFG